jgi:hypothetical protein
LSLSFSFLSCFSFSSVSLLSFSHLSLSPSCLSFSLIYLVSFSLSLFPLITDSYYHNNKKTTPAVQFSIHFSGRVHYGYI